jgi:hypothetical protein
MQRKLIIPLLLIVSMAIAAACSSLKLPGIGQNASSAQTPGAFDPKQMPLEMKLAVGTFKLEKTDLAVTPEEAKALLPLWKAVKTLGTSDTASQEEVSALYDQIKETMTPEQVQEIEKMELSPDDYNSLMKELGIRAPQGGPGGNLQNLSESERATRVAQFRSQNQSGRQNGGGGQFGPGGGGFPQGGNPGFAPPGGTTGQGSGRVSQTPGAGQRQARRGLGMNIMFVDPLIKMLETRAGG